MLKQQKFNKTKLIKYNKPIPTELIINILNTINTDADDLMDHHNIEKITFKEAFKLWNEYTTNVLTSSSIVCKFVENAFRERKHRIMSDHSKVVELEAEVAKLNSALTKSNDTIENLIIRVEDQKLQIDSLKVFKDLVVPKFVGIPNVTFRPKTTFDDFSQTYNTSFSASQKFNPTDGFVLKYFEIRLQELRSLQSIGIYNDNAFSVYLDVNFPFGSSFYVDHHDHSIKVNLNLLNPNGARTIGCGCLFKKGNYNGILFKNKTVVFFTLSGQFLGKFIEIEDGADFSPKFEVAGRDLDVQEFAKPNFTGNFQLNLDQVFDNEAYKADEWTVVDDNQE